jgi:two-component system sensor histidine kinase UhpB
MSTAGEKLVEARTLVVHALADVRKFVLDLRLKILDDLGLVPALRWYVRNRLEPVGINGHVESIGPDRSNAPSSGGDGISCGTAITNAVRHSQAKTVKILLEQNEGRLWDLAEDDGAGFFNGFNSG